MYIITHLADENIGLGDVRSQARSHKIENSRAKGPTRASVTPKLRLLLPKVKDFPQPDSEIVDMETRNREGQSYPSKSGAGEKLPIVHFALQAAPPPSKYYAS